MAKTCIRCSIEKLPQEFHRDRNRRDGRGSLCKLCATEKTAAWRSENVERSREYDRNRYTELRRAYSREYNRRQAADRTVGAQANDE